MAQDRLLLSDGSSNLLLSDGVSVLLLSTTSGPGVPPELDPNPYRRFYRLAAASTYDLDTTAKYRPDARATYRRT